MPPAVDYSDRRSVSLTFSFLVLIWLRFVGRAQQTLKNAGSLGMVVCRGSSRTLHVHRWLHAGMVTTCFHHVLNAVRESDDKSMLSPSIKCQNELLEYGNYIWQIFDSQIGTCTTENIAKWV
jgi:hypothetical protein